ncbi:UPF0738 family protein [Metabacillus niabensis]|uniref:UPF0738 protein J2S02_000466 n=1 Tax=Metabacillus niabensis TaxID=324854 RepID=A0ABT9YVX4_9BACI|nr:hypothetical protein [Metabacillus niabensis]MDQ0224144.1 CRISPR/Cas system-associated endonuclease Cas3-HD [Metabacillus niabensis]
MNKRIDVKEAVLEANRLILHTEDSLSEIKGSMNAKGQMLVDSDQLAFIYLLETDEDFIYAGLPHTIWSKLKEALDKSLPVLLKINDSEVELVQIIDELQYLIDNIKGNANYGEEMETKVTEVFS